MAWGDDANVGIGGLRNPAPAAPPPPPNNGLVAAITGTSPPVQATSGASGIAAAVGPPAVQQAQAVAPDPVYGRWGKELVEAILATIRKRESGGNYTAKNKSSSASGAYQFIDGTWGGYGGYKHAKDAPPEVQDRKAREDVIRILDSHNGDVTAVPQMWYYPAGYGKPGLKPPGANTLTMGQYTDAWMKTFNGITNGSIPAPASSAVASAPSAAPVGGGGGGTSGAVVPAGSLAAANAVLPGVGANATDAEIEDYVRSNYGYAAWVLDDPELGPIFKDAARNGFDAAKLRGRVEQTNWWKTRTEANRQFDVAMQTDSKSVQAQIAARGAEVRQQAQELGIELTDEQVFLISSASLRDAWSGTQLKNALTNEYHYHQANLRGQAQQFDEQYRQMVSDYGIPVSDATLGWWVEQTVKGTGDPGAVENYLRQQAKTLYPWMSEQIDAGMTPRQYADPYIQTAAQLLERNPSDFTLNDRLVKAALQGQPDDKGARRPMGLAEFEDFVRSTPDWDGTKQARAQGAEFANFLGGAFGMVA